MGEHWPKTKERKNPPCILNVWGYTAGKAVANATDDIMKYFSLNFKCTVFTVIHPVQHWAVWIKRNQMREAQAGGRNKIGLSILIQLLFKYEYQKEVKITFVITSNVMKLLITNLYCKLCFSAKIAAPSGYICTNSVHLEFKTLV